VVTRARRSEPTDFASLAARLDEGALRGIVVTAAEWHDDVARAVRLAANRATHDLTDLRLEIDRGLRTRRFLDYWESSAWAREAAPIIDELRTRARTAPTAELLGLIERSAGHVVKVILRADDSNGSIGDVACDLLDLHAQVCDSGVADPLKLAKWMVRFCFEDQDFFQLDPVTYRDALGASGLAAYRREVRRRVNGGDTQFAARYAEERLAVLDGDVQAIVRLLGGELRNPYQFIRVAEAMKELGRDGDVLAWASRGIAETSGWQVARLFDLACEVHADRGAASQVLALRRDQHRRVPSPTTYKVLREACEVAGAWPSEREAARAALDPGGLVDVLLADGEPEAAWQVTVDNPTWDPGGQRRMRLAEARESGHPADAFAVYLSLADTELETADRAAYMRAAGILKRARRAAKSADRVEIFADHVAALRERYRRRPTLIKILDKAGLA
jgi:hypothetical protein